LIWDLNKERSVWSGKSLGREFQREGRGNYEEGSVQPCPVEKDCNQLIFFHVSLPYTKVEPSGREHIFGLFSIRPVERSGVSGGNSEVRFRDWGVCVPLLIK